MDTFNAISNWHEGVRAVLEVHMYTDPQKPNEEFIRNLQVDLSEKLLYIDDHIKRSII